MLIELEEGVKRAQSIYFRDWYDTHKDSWNSERKEKRQNPSFKEQERKRRIRMKWGNYIPPGDIDPTPQIETFKNHTVTLSLPVSRTEAIDFLCVPMKIVTNSLGVCHRTYLYWVSKGLITNTMFKQGTENFMPLEIAEAFLFNLKYKSYPYKDIRNWVFLRKVKLAQEDFLKKLKPFGLSQKVFQRKTEKKK